MEAPVFIISLPRSGSTLLQKMLSSHPEVASSAEPWIMLPFWSMRIADSARSVYSHHTAANALNDFLDGLPDGSEQYASAVGAFGRHLYEAGSDGKRFFIDKTPRYYLMLDLLQAAFPEAKFLILTRNPLAAIASACEAFHRGRFRWVDYEIDWMEGVPRLAAAVELASMRSEKMTVVRYEELVCKPTAVIRHLCDWLSLPFHEEMVWDYKNRKLSGRMGDPVGIHKYHQVTPDSLSKWKDFFASRFRRRVAEDLLEAIGHDVIERLGYSAKNLLQELDPVGSSLHSEVTSRVDYAVGRLCNVFDYRYLQARYRARKRRRRFVAGYYVARF